MSTTWPKNAVIQQIIPAPSGFVYPWKHSVSKDGKALYAHSPLLALALVKFKDDEGDGEAEWQSVVGVGWTTYSDEPGDFVDLMDIGPPGSECDVPSDCDVHRESDWV